MLITLDLETNTKHDTIWCGVTENLETGEILVHTSPETLVPVLRDSTGVIGHNIIGFDAPVLENVWGIHIPIHILIDTLVLSRLYSPSIDGGHSLDSWGKRLGDHKIDFSDYDGGLSDEMIEYCKQDVKLTTTVYKYLINLLNTEGFFRSMRRFRTPSRYHYGGSGEKWLRARRHVGRHPCIRR